MGTMETDTWMQPGKPECSFTIWSKPKPLTIIAGETRLEIEP